MKHAELVCSEHNGLDGGSPAYFYCKDQTVWAVCDGGYCEIKD